jgi:hypothetical protein
LRADIKERWVEALRSGRYVQGKGKLNKGDKFCCLGVLCDLAERDGVVTSHIAKGGERVYSGPEGSGSAILPQAVATWAGLDRLIPAVDGLGDAAEANDYGMSFSTIADWIEKGL